ncbi:lipase family protein [Shimia ponticola]|uniref:lipase family protein n=1 Tax=Shimia ponticola TaxID=2582893 RepID=UPI0011BF46B6|nr:lipase family protein [Shimia ponticola]
MSNHNIGIDAQMATLAAIAYVGETGKKSDIRGDIETELKNTTYATHHAGWQRLWGPVTLYDDNLVFVAQNTAGDIAIVLRGTVYDDLKSWYEDLPDALEPTHFPSAIPGKVSSKFKTAVFDMANATDPVDGTPMMTTVKAATGKIYVTGHSQGAGLAPLMHAYVAAMGDIALSRITSHTFAAPSTGDPTFATYVSTTLDSTRYYNMLDIVPTGYANMSDIWEIGLPVKATIDQGLIRVAVDGWSLATGLSQSDFAQPDAKVVALNTQKKHVPNDPSYYDSVVGQHNHNTYLYLLGAHQTDVADGSPFGPTPNQS